MEQGIIFSNISSMKYGSKPGKLGDWQKSLRRQVMSNIVTVTCMAFCMVSKCSRRPWVCKRFTFGSIPVCITNWWVESISGGAGVSGVDGSAHSISMSEWKVILFKPTENVAIARRQTNRNLPACVSRMSPRTRSCPWIRPRTHSIPRSPFALP